MLTRTIPEPAKHVLILVARITVSFIMLAHVWQSFFQAGFGAATDQFTNFGIPLAIVATAFTLVVELVGSVLIAVGLFVPWACAGMAFVMYGAIYFVHGAHGVFVKDNGFELVALIAGLCLAIAAFGPGRFSLDHLIFDRIRAAGPAPLDVSSDPSSVPVAPAPAPFSSAPAPRWEDDRRLEAAQVGLAPRWDAVEQPVSLWEAPPTAAAPAAPATGPNGTRLPGAYASMRAARAGRPEAPRPADRADAPVWAEPPAPQQTGPHTGRQRQVVDYAEYADPNTGPHTHAFPVVGERQ